ncbi:hypothetical protein LAA29_30035 [Leuconostoc carnosum]|nr:hypothetical protein LCAC16_40035 [Leuconostoc carnosum]SPO34055.1 hypothetical protein LAA29_30035 [Leuconostoc carnosum]
MSKRSGFLYDIESVSYAQFNGVIIRLVYYLNAFFFSMKLILT